MYTDIAASEDEAVEETLPTESEIATVEETTSAVEATPTVEAAAVEAARPTVTAMAYTKPRIEVTAAKYAENTIRAALGDESARQYIAAADNTTDNAGLVPTRQLSEIINPLGTTIRPSIEAISRGVLPDAGMTFEIPKITVVPTVADVNEAAAITETGMETSFLSVSVNKYAGGQTFSVELLDRSNPVFFTELVRQMEFAYAKATDDFVGDEIANNGTLNATATTEDKDGLLTFVSSAAAAVYGASLGFARNLVVSPQQWGKIIYFGDWSKYIIRQVANNVLVPLRERFMDEMELGFLMYARFDGKLIQTAAIKHLKNL